MMYMFCDLFSAVSDAYIHLFYAFTKGNINSKAILLIHF